MQVAKNIATAIIIGIVSRAANVLFQRVQLYLRVRGRAKAVSQSALEESYKGPKFDLALNYGQHLQVRCWCWCW
jgi:hypothetical protein